MLEAKNTFQLLTCQDTLTHIGRREVNVHDAYKGVVANTDKNSTAKKRDGRKPWCALLNFHKLCLALQ